MKGDSKYRHEFSIVVDLKETITVPVYRTLSEEERSELREINKEAGVAMVPKRIKVSEKSEEVTIKKNILVKKTFPDIRQLTIQEALTPKGTIMKGKFIIEDSNKWYIVKGDYGKFKSYVESLISNSSQASIGYRNNIEDVNNS